jgi:hypothetical protein
LSAPVSGFSKEFYVAEDVQGAQDIVIYIEFFNEFQDVVDGGYRLDWHAHFNLHPLAKTCATDAITHFSVQGQCPKEVGCGSLKVVAWTTGFGAELPRCGCGARDTAEVASQSHPASR